MLLYPNPADEQFMIRTSGDLISGNVVVLDAMGREVLRTHYRLGHPSQLLALLQACISCV